VKNLAPQNLVKYFLFVWLFSAYAHSGEPSVIPPSTQSDIELDQANRLKNIEEARKSVQQLQAIPEVPRVASSSEDNCFNVQNIEFEGNSLFHSDEIMSWLDFQPSCIGLSSVNEYLRIITNRYIQEGYITSRAFLVPQDLSSGTLKIVIVEGRLESMLFNGKQEGFLQQAFSNIEGKILNLRDIEQGLDQINRLNRYNARIKLEPGTQQGYSVITP
jgi:hemolysin activation/secretion protein